MPGLTRPSTMTPRQRVLAAMRRQPPDRVPRELSWGAFTPALMEVFRQRTGADDPAEYFGFEARSVSFHTPAPAPDYWRYHADLPPDATLDAWGVASVVGSTYHFRRRFHPLARAQTADEIVAYPLPDYMDPRYHAHLDAAVAALHARELASMGELVTTLFEVSWALRGMVELLTDMVLRPELAEVLLERVTALRCAQARRYALAGVDILRLGDDVGTQRGMLMSPALWREWLKPRLARIIAAAHAVKPDILIFYHCDGDCRAIIPDLIEVGLDILNPVQPECMNPTEIKALYGDRLAFWGTMGTQTTFPFGTPDEVRAMVRERIATVGRGGGLLLAPTHILEPEVPWENVLAFFQAIDEYEGDA